MRYNVYNSNGSVKAQVNAIEYHGDWMGERYINVSIASASPLSLCVGDYIIYRNERFELNVEPSIQKQAVINTYGEGFKYDKVKFNSLTDELVRCMFFDCTSASNVYSVGTQSKFSFYCPTVAELGKRIQANLDRLYTGTKKWTIQVAEGYTPTTDKEQNQSLSADNINCWQALAMAYESMDVKFIVEKTARTITLGTSGTIHNVMRFGRGNGLKKITKTSKSDQNVVTKVRAYGNTTNLPQHYYYYKALHCVAPVSIYTPSQSGQVKASYFYIATPSGVSSTSMLFLIRNDAYETTSGTYTHTIKAYSNGVKFYEGTDKLSYDSECSGIKFQNLFNWYASKTNVTVEIVTCNKNYIPVSFKKSDVANEAQLIPVQNLMLPGYPETTLDPFVVSDKIDELGVREAVVYFDGSDDNDDIYPTMEGMTMKELEDAGYTAYIATEDSSKAKKDIRLDAVLDGSRKPKNPISSAEDYFNNSTIDDDGIFDNESFDDADGHFLIRIRNIGFGLADADIKLSGTEYPKLCMKDGLCGGREFDVVDCKKATNNTYYTLQCQRVKDDSLNQYFPNKNSLIKAEDKFVITNINMPDIYIDTASVRLQTAANAWLVENDVTTYQIAVEIDNIYLARQHDNAVATNGTSIHDTIKEGDVLCIKDTDLNLDEVIEIANITIKESEKGVPEYSVTLNADKDASTIQRIQNSINGIVNGSIAVGGMSMSQIKDVVNTQIKNLKLDETYLDKTKDDVAKGSYNFYGDLEFGDPSDNEKKYVENVQGLKLFHNGSGWCINTDYLNVTKKAVFTELEIQKVTHIGGQQLLTACGDKVAHVVSENGSSTTKYHYIFFPKVDADGNAKTDDWKMGDLVYCQSFNVGSGTTEGAGSRYYWVRVVGKIAPTPVSGTTLTSNTGEEFDPNDYYCLKFRYNSSTSYSDHPVFNPKSPSVNLDKSSCDIPIKGDNVVLFGHVKQSSETEEEAAERQGATLLAGAGRWGQALIMWRGIGADSNSPFYMPGPRVEIGASKVKIQADEMTLASDGVLELSSNQLLCTNKDGDLTAYLDELGNFITSGIQDQMVQEVYDAETFLERFIPIPGYDTINPIDQKEVGYTSRTWEYYTDKQGEVYLYDEAYKVANDDDLSDYVECTAIAPCSDSGLVYSDVEFGNRGSHIQCCMDMRCAEGVINISWLPLKTSNWNGADAEPFVGIYLPFFQNYGYDISKRDWETRYFRTPTRMNMKTSFISMVQLKSLIGRKFTLVNDTKGFIKIMYDFNIANMVVLQPDDYVTFEFVGEVRQGSMNLQYYDIYGNLITRNNVSIGEFMWKPVADESFLNVDQNQLDDDSFSTSFYI